MKEINGTITLAYVEEDNRQRVIFRVIPLCTREGNVFHGGADDFPDEGSLRIVPDKREQSTFKERMREAGGLCAIQLASEGKELMKVRQNRNYAPEEGERNQYAIYSDVICELAEDGCFEVVEPGTDASHALTAKVLLHKDKMLYGPVEKEQALKAAVEGLKPFGNDRFLLHTVETPALGRHSIYWDPEATLNWRQRRNSLRRKERAAASEEEKARKGESKAKAEEKPRKEKPEAPVKAEAKPEKPVKQDPHTRRVERAAEIVRQEEEQKAREAAAAAEATVQQPPREEAEEALPIGAHLDILDSDLPFEQQISRLAQPLSEGANRLTNDAPEPEEEAPQTVARFTGTPLVNVGEKIVRTRRHPESMHHVVERQMRGQRDEIMGEELGSGTYGLVENPIESLRTCMEYVWQNADMRQQAMDMLMENEAFTTDVAAALRRGGINLNATAAAREQLAEIEADRISLLMQLETAKENEKKFREKAIASLSQKRRDEAERLKKEVDQLSRQREELLEQSRALSTENASRLTEFIAGQMSCLSGAGEQRVLLSPVVGRTYAQQELADGVHRHPQGGAQIFGHVLARNAVAARGAADEDAVFVLKRHGEAVYLRLCAVFAALGQRREHTLVKGAQLLKGEHVVQAFKRDLVHDGRECALGRAAHFLRGRRGRVKLRVRRLKLLQAAHQRVVFKVADNRGVLVVIVPVVLHYLGSEGLYLLFNVHIKSPYPNRSAAPCRL